MKTFIAILSTAFSLSAFATCGSHLRFIHGEAFRDQPVSIRVNGITVKESLSFRSVSKYFELSAGKKVVEIVDKETGEVLETKTFTAGPNVGYTVLFAGPAKGPQGMSFGNSSPFVVIDDITPVTNPGRWKGTWYRMSETNVVIDLRISKGEDYSQEMGRLQKKENRSTYQMGDFPAGRYSFNPVMPGSSEPFFNPALEPARIVEVKDLNIEGGENVDIIALGNFLGKAPNSLDLVSVKYKSRLSEEGCYVIE